MIASIVYNLCRVFLLLAILMAGLVKITPDIDASRHEMAVRSFQEYANIWHIHQFTDADTFRLAVAGVEILAAVLMLVMPVMAATIISWLMIGAIATHYLLDQHERIIVHAVVFVLATLVILLGVERRRVVIKAKAE